MNVKIKKLEKRDFPKAISFAIEGMHFDRYVDNKLALQLYGRYFLYLEMERATQIFAAYIEDNLVGILMVNMKQQPKKYSSFWRKCYVKLMKAIMAAAVKGGSDIYDEANRAMLSDYMKYAAPDGEICFLATDPTMQGKGIGTLLLRELIQYEEGKRIYLYTDDNCSYQFYESKGFIRAEEKEIEMKIAGKAMTLNCLLYSKQL